MAPSAIIGWRDISQIMGTQATTLPKNVDHLIFAIADLDAGIDRFEQLLGVRPVRGGRHPEYGTHNAQLSLGATTYLEIIAPDPQADVVERVPLFGPDGFRQPRLVTWVLRSESIEETAALATAKGVGLGSVEAGKRVKPDGTVVSWKLTNPSAMPLDGAVPFLISWGDTPHPAGGAPRAGELVGIGIEHPEPERVRQALTALGVEMVVHSGDQFRMSARIRTSRGEVEIR